MKELEEKLESHDRDISGLKEMVFAMCQNVDRLMGEIREVTLSREKDRSLVLEGSQRKGKLTKTEEGESSQVRLGGVVIEPSGVIVLENFLPLDLGRLDVILGITWLYTMGYMGVDWPTLTMTFARGGSLVVLKGEASLTKADSLMKCW